MMARALVAAMATPAARYLARLRTGAGDSSSVVDARRGDCKILLLESSWRFAGKFL
ncbi:hypothetical protein MBRU_17750 [Mycolicibacterium brumae DSM 44177]|nr:hypothetical protein MBRU_17750 [Mycolicibacterium brumae DSM 44177]